MSDVLKVVRFDLGKSVDVYSEFSGVEETQFFNDTVSLSYDDACDLRDCIDEIFDAYNSGDKVQKGGISVSMDNDNKAVYFELDLLDTFHMFNLSFNDAKVLSEYIDNQLLVYS